MESLPELVKELKSELSLVRETLMRGFFAHTAGQSPVASHCRLHALSAPRGTTLGAPCDPAQHSVDGAGPASTPARKAGTAPYRSIGFPPAPSCMGVFKQPQDWTTTLRAWCC